MAIVRSFGSLQSIATTGPQLTGASSGSLALYGTSQSYGALYKAQPNIRTVVDFLGRNIAQLGLHVFRRLSDTDRERVAGHQLAGWLSHPNPSTTRYRLIESTIQDLAIYFNAYWLKVRTDTLGLVRMPPDQMRAEGALQTQVFIWSTTDGREVPFAPKEIVHFSGYNPESSVMGLSPLETLRRVLAEEYAAGQYRESFWRNAARIEGVVTRPKDKIAYTAAQAQSWREQWQAVYAGGAGSGKTVLLQDGETWAPTSFSAKDSEYLSARKLAREECAAAYHVPLPMVGILEHATFSNIKEQHKHLYQDCLGPWLVMIAQELERQLLVECQDQRDIYLEFNIAEKMKGTLEEQTESLVKATGGPIMTVNEARARLNLPSMDTESADAVAAPLNMSTGAPDPDAASVSDAAVDVSPVLEATHTRLRSRLAKVSQPPRWWQWQKELAADLTPLVGPEQAEAIAARDMVDTRRLLEAEASYV